MEVSEEELLAIREVGPRVARSIRTFFDNPRNREVIEKILAAGVQLRKKQDGRPPSGRERLCPYRQTGRDDPRAGQRKN